MLRFLKREQNNLWKYWSVVSCVKFLYFLLLWRNQYFQHATGSNLAIFKFIKCKKIIKDKIICVVCNYYDTKWIKFVLIKTKWGVEHFHINYFSQISSPRRRNEMGMEWVLKSSFLTVLLATWKFNCYFIIRKTNLFTR